MRDQEDQSAVRQLRGGEGGALLYRRQPRGDHPGDQEVRHQPRRAQVQQDQPRAARPEVRGPAEGVQASVRRLLRNSA